MPQAHLREVQVQAHAQATPHSRVLTRKQVHRGQRMPEYQPTPEDSGLAVALRTWRS